MGGTDPPSPYISTHTSLVYRIAGAVCQSLLIANNPAGPKTRSFHSQCGTYAELQENSGAFAEFLQTFASENNSGIFSFYRFEVKLTN